MRFLDQSMTRLMVVLQNSLRARCVNLTRQGGSELDSLDTTIDELSLLQASSLRNSKGRYWRSSEPNTRSFALVLGFHSNHSLVACFRDPKAHVHLLIQNIEPTKVAF